MLNLFFSSCFVEQAIISEEGEVVEVREDVGDQYKINEIFQVGRCLAGEPLAVFVKHRSDAARAEAVSSARAGALNFSDARGGSAPALNDAANKKAAEVLLHDADAHQEGGRRGGLMAQAKASKEAAEARKRGKKSAFAAGVGVVGSKRVIKPEDTMARCVVERQSMGG